MNQVAANSLKNNVYTKSHYRLALKTPQTSHELDQVKPDVEQRNIIYLKGRSASQQKRQEYSPKEKVMTPYQPIKIKKRDSILSEMSATARSSKLNADLPPDSYIKKAGFQNYTIVEDLNRYRHEAREKTINVSGFMEEQRRKMQTVMGVTLPILNLELIKRDPNIKSSRRKSIMSTHYQSQRKMLSNMTRKQPDKSPFMGLNSQLIPKSHLLQSKRTSVPEISKLHQTSSIDIKPEKAPLPFDFKEDYLKRNFNLKNRRRSPKTGKSGEPLSVMRDMRVSSRLMDTDVEALSQRLIQNKINHKEYQPELFEQSTIRRIKKVIKQNSKQSPYSMPVNPIKKAESGVRHQSPRVPQQSSSNFVERIIAEQLIPKAEQVELNRKRRADEIMKKNLEQSSIGNNQYSPRARHNNSPKFNPTEFIKKEVFDKISYNDSHGFVPERSYSRLKRLRTEFYKSFKRNFVNPNSLYSSILQPPDMQGLKHFTKLNDMKQLAAQVINGEYDLDEEEDRLNKLIMKGLSKQQRISLLCSSKGRMHSQRSKTSLQSDKVYKQGKAKFISKTPLGITINKNQKTLNNNQFMQIGISVPSETNIASTAMNERFDTSAIDHQQSSASPLDVTDAYSKYSHFDNSSIEGDVYGMTLNPFHNSPSRKIKFLATQNRFKAPSFRSTPRHEIGTPNFHVENQGNIDHQPRVKKRNHCQFSKTQQLQSDIKQIIDKTNQKAVEIDPHLFKEIKSIERQQQHLSKGIDDYFESERLQDAHERLKSKSEMYNRKFEHDQPLSISNILDHVKEKEAMREQNKNFKDKETLDQVHIENLQNSIFIAKLGSKHLWKPSKALSGRKSKILLQMLGQ
ncbi:hypothetical protein FGO68_gene15385 [Halteria grandinella]|uniref:Uncharacterized protein n=1 Tax=Halteria grandinella TaxID=5974 RepID=A0A8J8T9M8_HALGN|nr:hypothetical protein FGO68_gene15385 [Halteria grandinella]